MNAALPVAHAVERAYRGDVAAVVTLDFAGRFLRRRRLVASDGRAFVVDLAHTLSLDAGDAFLCDDGRAIGVASAEETLLEIAGPEIVRYAWHIGNRHAPCEIGAEWLRIQDDPVIARMLAQMGAEVRPIMAAFTPEGGAYGHGRTHGHRHD